MKSSTTAAIETDGLSKRFSRITAVADLSVVVDPGEIVGCLGPNGAGKTTTIRMLLGFLRPTAGQCRVLGGIGRPGEGVAAGALRVTLALADRQ